MKAAVDRTWAVLADPRLMSLWNPKCLRCSADEEQVRVGLRFQAAFRPRGPELETDCEVLECQPEQVVRLRFSGAAFSKGCYVDETFVLRPVRNGTRVIHDVDFSHSGLPWAVRLLLKVIPLVGYKVGESSLDRIKELAGEPT